MIVTKLKNSVLFKNTFIYTLLQLINSGVPFLLLPVLTRYLTPEDYGMIATYNTFVGVVSIFVGLSMAGAVGVSFFHLKQEELKKYIGNVFNILILSVSVVTLFIMVLEPYLIEKLRVACSLVIYCNIRGLDADVYSYKSNIMAFTAKS